MSTTVNGVSPLSGLFTGETLRLFSGLAFHDQDRLQTLFDQRAASAREIELALQAEANLALCLRAALERPPFCGGACSGGNLGRA